MSLRLSISEAEEKKIISQAQAREMRLKQGAGRANRKAAQGWPAKSGSQKQKPSVCPIDGDSPQEKLWRALVKKYPDLVKSNTLCWEIKHIVPGRKYSVDMGFKDLCLGLELDGWEFHGKNIKNFKRDRQKDRLMLLSGWRVMRFYASEINNEIDQVIDIIEQARAVVAQEKALAAEGAQCCS